jgi:hypothetical protein
MLQVSGPVYGPLQVALHGIDGPATIAICRARDATVVGGFIFFFLAAVENLLRAYGRAACLQRGPKFAVLGCWIWSKLATRELAGVDKIHLVVCCSLLLQGL